MSADAGRPAPGAAALAVEGLSKRFGAVAALDDVTLEVAPGEWLALLGPSGCGKTTLLRAVAGLERQDAGRVLLGGRPLDGVPPHRRGLGLVFQSHALFPHLSVARNVAFGLEAQGLAPDAVRARVAAALARVRLRGLDDRTPDALSGGQQQRVGLARAIATAPRALLLDEPLSSLDQGLRVALREELRAVVRALGVTTLAVTHDQEEALATADRVAVLRSGRVEQVGAPWDVYAAPATRFVAGFVGRLGRLPPAVEAALAPRWGAPLGALTWHVRPEDVALRPGHAPAGETSAGPGLQGDAPTWPAVVVDAVFLGVHVQYRVRAVEVPGAGGALAGAARGGDGAGELPTGARDRRLDGADDDDEPDALEVFVPRPPAADGLLRPGAPVTLAVDPARVHAFERATGRRRPAPGDGFAPAPRDGPAP